jgi:integrase
MASARADSAREARAFLARARQASQQLGHDGNHAWTAFGPTNVAVHDLSVAMELGDLLADDKGGRCTGGNFNKRVRWVESVAAIGAPGLHFHDLRHTGNTFAAMSGASLRDLMTRMGHDSMRAALIYQHKTQGADRKIADRLEALIQSHRDTAGDGCRV